MSKINPFTDMNDSAYWAFYDVIKDANKHMALSPQTVMFGRNNLIIHGKVILQVLSFYNACGIMG